MRRGLLAGALIGAALSACDAHGRAPAADAPAVDTPIDAPRPRNDPGMGPVVQPFDATFVTPAGSLETQQLYAQAIWGDCDPPSWELRFTPDGTGAQASVTLHITMPRWTGVEVTGTLPASADYFADTPFVAHSTQKVTFEATRIDYPADGAPRITGTFRDTDPAWTIDLAVDVLGLSAGCI